MNPRPLTLLVVLAAATSGCITSESLVGQTKIHVFDGDYANHRFAESVAGCGDIDKDGCADLIVGTPFDDFTGADAGRACVFSGKDGSVLYTFYGDSPGDYLGWEVDGAGDVNGDGWLDLIAAVFGDDHNGFDSGGARVFSGKDGSILHTFHGDATLDLMGSGVAGVGDVDKDGCDDVVVGAYHDDNNGPESGSARVFSGKDGSILYQFDGPRPTMDFGFSVDAAGDVDMDGYPDVIVGADGDDLFGTDSGSAWVFSGRDGTVLHTFYGQAAGDHFGREVDGADIDLDGYSDLLISAYFEDTANGVDSGSASVLSGKTGAVLFHFIGDATGDRFGGALAAATDVNNDGYVDIIVGALLGDHNGVETGSARVHSGKDGSVLCNLYGDSDKDRFGAVVDGAGDVDGDGYGDVIVSAFFDDNNGSNSGSATVFSGRLNCSPNAPPDCSNARPSLDVLWPPNHKFVAIDVLGVVDPDGDPITITIDSIRQDEPVLQAGGGSGNTGPDGMGVGTSTAAVRSERNGNRKTPGNGRVYTIEFTADDGKGGSCQGTLKVSVPHHKKSPAVDDGPNYDSTT